MLGPERHDRLPGTDGSSDPQIEPRSSFVELGDGRHGRQPAPDGSLRVVAVRERRSEDGHARVADELLDRPAEPVGLDAERVVEQGQSIPDVLRVFVVGARGRSDDIDEQHRDQLALLLRRLRAERGPTGLAEASVVVVAPSASSAREHGRQPSRSTDRGPTRPC